MAKTSFDGFAPLADGLQVRWHQHRQMALTMYSSTQVPQFFQPHQRSQPFQGMLELRPQEISEWILQTMSD